MKRKKKPLTALRKMRMSRFITQTELAEKMGVLPGCVSTLERNGIKQIRTAERYAAALGCRPEELMDFAAPALACAGR